MFNVQILPSVLAADPGRLAEEAVRVTDAGADGIHVDIMDGHFVPNLTFGPQVVQALRKATHLPLDVHLMIEQPERWIETYANAGASLLYVHVEACTHLHRVLQQIRRANIKVGVSLNPATPFDALTYVLDDIDRILVMSVNPGFGGQSFIPSMLSKLEKLRVFLKNRSIEVIVDGGVTSENAKQIIQAGATGLVAGAAIFSKPNYAQAISALRTFAQEGATLFLRKEPLQ